MKYQSEQALINRLRQHWEALGVPVIEGVPVGSRCADVVIILEGQYISVETKLHNWRNAISQAKDHLIAADKTYICIPHIPREADVIGECQKRGVGLWTLPPDGELTEHVSAQFSPENQYEYLRDRFREYADKCVTGQKQSEIQSMSLSDEITQYFETVNDEDFLRAAQRAGFTMVPKQPYSKDKDSVKS